MIFPNDRILVDGVDITEDVKAVLDEMDRAEMEEAQREQALAAKYRPERGALGDLGYFDMQIHPKFMHKIRQIYGVYDEQGNLIQDPWDDPAFVEWAKRKWEAIRVKYKSAKPILTPGGDNYFNIDWAMKNAGPAMPKSKPEPLTGVRDGAAPKPAGEIVLS